MAGREHGLEQRKAFRCAVSGPKKQVHLRIGQQVVEGTLHDQSAGGFAVDVVERPPVEVDDVIHMALDATLFEVRVARIAQLESKGFAGVRDGARFRIGLQRLRELAVAPMVRPQQPGGAPTFDTSILRRHTGGIVLALALAATVVLAPLVGLRWVQQRGDSLGGAMERLLERWTERAERIPASASRVPAWPSTPPRSNASGPPPTVADQSWATVPEQSKVAQLLRLPGASPFLTPELVQRLHLTEAQQQRIAQIVEQTTQQLAELDERSYALSRQAQSQQAELLLQQARHQAEALLTDEQRKQLEELLANQQNP